MNRFFPLVLNTGTVKKIMILQCASKIKIKIAYQHRYVKAGCKRREFRLESLTRIETSSLDYGRRQSAIL